MCLCDSSCIASPALRVVINISYTPPEPGYQPPYYRAASSVTLTCRGLGVSGQIRYYWTSTCSSCFVPGGWYYSYSGSSRTQSYLVARDAGTHTCSAHSDSYGISGSTTTVMNVVGECILVETHCCTTKSYWAMVKLSTREREISSFSSLHGATVGFGSGWSQTIVVHFSKLSWP